MKDQKNLTQWKGACHCGGIRFIFASTKQAVDLPLRSCTCSFCVKRGTQCTSDSAGFVKLKIKAGTLSSYDSTAKLQRILCRHCGVYVGTFLRGSEKGFVTINVKTFERKDDFTQPATPVDYSGTTLKERKERWKTVWTPVKGQFT